MLKLNLLNLSFSPQKRKEKKTKKKNKKKIQNNRLRKLKIDSKKLSNHFYSYPKITF